MLLYCSRNKHSPTTPAKLNITTSYYYYVGTVFHCRALSSLLSVWLECLGSADYRASRDKQYCGLCVITDGDGEVALLWSDAGPVWLILARQSSHYQALVNWKIELRLRPVSSHRQTKLSSSACPVLSDGTQVRRGEEGVRTIRFPSSSPCIYADQGVEAG